jgi:hypothetical protein
VKRHTTLKFTTDNTIKIYLRAISGHDHLLIHNILRREALRGKKLDRSMFRNKAESQILNIVYRRTMLHYKKNKSTYVVIIDKKL